MEPVPISFLGTKYGPLACIIKTRLIHEDPMPMPNLPTAATSLPAADQTMVGNILYAEQLKSWAKEKISNSKKYIEMYPIIWNYISLESQLQVMDIADWSTIEDSQDVARLMKRITETHRTGEVRIAPLALKLAKQRYETCRQSSTETVAEYKKRFVESSQLLRSIRRAQHPRRRTRH